MTEVDWGSIQAFLIKEREGRVIRNVTKSTIHVGSFHNLTGEEIIEVVSTADRLEDFLNPIAVGELFTALSSQDRGGQPIGLFRLVAQKLLIANMAKLGQKYDFDNPVHMFLSDIAHTTAYQSAMDMGLIEPDQAQIDNTIFEKHHGWYVPTNKKYSRIKDEEFKQIKSVCVHPRLARRWIEAFKEGYVLAAASR